MEPTNTDGTAASPTAPTEPTVAIVAPEPVEGASVGAKIPLSEMTPDQRREWRKTGIAPDASAASSTATADGQPAPTGATSKPASEPAHDDPDYKPKTARRIKELLDENKRLQALIGTSTAAPVAPAVSTPAPAVVSKLVRPDSEDPKYTYGSVDPDFQEDLAVYVVAKSREEDAARAATAAQNATVEETAKRIQASWKDRVSAAKTKHADFAAVALEQSCDIPAGSMVDAWILESEHGAEVLYDLMKNPAERARILAIGSPQQQVRELVALEARVSAPLKTQTTAPEPGPTLGVRAGDPASASVRAVKKGDAGSYIRERNREEIAARSTRRKG